MLFTEDEFIDTTLTIVKEYLETYSYYSDGYDSIMCLRLEGNRWKFRLLLDDGKNRFDWTPWVRYDKDTHEYGYKDRDGLKVYREEDYHQMIHDIVHDTLWWCTICAL